MKPLLVGEANPYGGDPAYALYPLPLRASGDNLCTKVMGLDRRAYLDSFDRVNLCPERWSVVTARANARAILAEPKRDRIVLLGSKVCGAFGLPYEPFSVRIGYARIPEIRKMIADEGVSINPEDQRAIVVLPHPSGLCRKWNEPGAYELARNALRKAGVLPQ